MGILAPMPLSELPAFVGRQRHLDQMLSDAARARTGQARAVLLCGDAGIGKPRLIAEYLDRTPLARSATGACLELRPVPGRGTGLVVGPATVRASAGTSGARTG